jgi:hypothetical protein
VYVYLTPFLHLVNVQFTLYNIYSESTYCSNV